jgi:polysaccharide export outer membrane protein
MASTVKTFPICAPVAALKVAALLGMLTTPLLADDQQEADVNIVEEPAYLVNPGDVLIISVWKEEDLQRQIIVRPDGSFSFPLTGDIVAKGRSIEEIRTAVGEQLEKFIPDPVVTVSVQELGGNIVYVIGQVNRPGPFQTGRRVDVMQALAMGGGTTTFAQLGGIKILRRVNGKQIAIPFDYKDIEKGKRLNQNILLEPGDVVVVP